MSRWNLSQTRLDRCNDRVLAEFKLWSPYIIKSGTYWYLAKDSTIMGKSGLVRFTYHVHCQLKLTLASPVSGWRSRSGNTGFLLWNVQITFIDNIWLADNFKGFFNGIFRQRFINKAWFTYISQTKSYDFAVIARSCDPDVLREDDSQLYSLIFFYQTNKKSRHKRHG